MDRLKKAADSATPAKKTAVGQTVVKKIAARATKASAQLENRQVPTGHVRSAGVQRLLSERQGRKR
ncbi:hypothetical protein ABQE62_07155 [Mycolicibacterium fortuitum]